MGLFQRYIVTGPRIPGKRPGQNSVYAERTADSLEVRIGIGAPNGSLRAALVTYESSHTSRRARVGFDRRVRGECE